ncbi:hypothetical protein WJX75_005692 [Coccomyxa subellipsoidea]|uniref:RING-type domain-containing protein n=1 Tax=Coccomyxa subellipsoidea TaxID=248742 RepID=A0ABR2YXP7_9CHLO
MLWRRLFLARWGPIGDELDNAKEWERPPTWKERYMERDTLELQEVCGSVSELMRPFYAQMTVAKRSLSLGRQHPEDLPLVNAQYAGQVVAWRRARGLPISAPAHHTCQGRCSYSKLGTNVFVCEQCGWAHLCGEGCTERFMDLSSELPVCPISGRCFTRMMTWAEEAREMDVRDTKGEEGACDHMEDFSTAGRLARAYVDGYNCTNEEELRRLLVTFRSGNRYSVPLAVSASGCSALAINLDSKLVRSSCPSNSSLSVQVLNRRAMQRTRDRRLLQSSAMAPAPSNASMVDLAPGYAFPADDTLLPSPGPTMGSLGSAPLAAPNAFPGLLVLGNKSISGNSSSGQLLLSSDQPDTPLPPVVVPPPTATVQCCCYNATYNPFTITVSSVVIAFAFCLGFALFYAARVMRQRARLHTAEDATRSDTEMVPKKTVEQSLDMEGQSRDCPVCWDKNLDCQRSQRVSNSHGQEL